jgi:hypothetical protein
MYMALPQTQYVLLITDHLRKSATDHFRALYRGAQVVFRSVIEPIFARFFTGAAASDNLKSQAEKVSGKSL